MHCIAKKFFNQNPNFAPSQKMIKNEIFNFSFSCTCIFNGFVPESGEKVYRKYGDDPWYNL